MTSEELDKLIDKYLSGKTSSAEERLIDEFFTSQQKSQKLQHYKLSESMWSSIQNRINETSKGIHFSSSSKLKRNYRAVILACVTAVILITTGWFLIDQDFLKSGKEISVVTSVAPRGQKSLITLSDGSRVYLNSGSTLSYPEVFSADKREIKLSGEAFFDVSRDESRPFIIHSGNVTTKVLGTSFNIEAFDGEDVSVTVATGKVQVDALQKSGKTNKVILTPNQRTVYNYRSGFITSNVNIERFIAWKTNTLYFEDTPLQDASSVLKRWYNVSIDFDNEEIKKCRINGQYKDQTLTGVLKSIQYMYKVDYKFIEENKIILYGKGCNQ